MPVRILHSIHDVTASDWNALDLRGQPFLRHEFLAALEDTGCACAETGWAPYHVVLIDDSTRIIQAAMPLYLKSHSFGEFVFDFSWAEAFAQAGLNYYPKLVSAIPFTPATGPRILLSLQADANNAAQLNHAGLLQAAVELLQDHNLSSIHVLYADEATRNHLFTSAVDLSDNKSAHPELVEGLLTNNHETLRHAQRERRSEFDSETNNEWLPRTSCDFHWYNRGYQSMDDFLESFRADKRKKAKRERRRVVEQGIVFKTLHGCDLTRELCEIIFAFSEHTFHEHGHEHYLNADFFYRIAQVLPSQLMIKLAEYQGRAVAAAIFFVGKDTLFGRYWGASGNFDSLHFETCYYQGIEYCIEHGLQKFEPGTQGEHKIARGFEPTLTHSAHYIRDERFRNALRPYLQRERHAVDKYAEAMREHVPFHRI
jgi:predicted N-acyltransferase